MINICTKYGFDILIISSSGGHRRHTINDRQQTMDTAVGHKLPTGELKRKIYLKI